MREHGRSPPSNLPHIAFGGIEVRDWSAYDIFLVDQRATPSRNLIRHLILSYANLNLKTKTLRSGKKFLGRFSPIRNDIRTSAKFF